MAATTLIQPVLEHVLVKHDMMVKSSTVEFKTQVMTERYESVEGLVVHVCTQRILFP